MARDRQRSKARQRARAAGQPPRGKRSRPQDSSTPPELEGATPYVDEAQLAEQGADVPPADDDATEVGVTEDELTRAADEVEIPRDLVESGVRRSAGEEGPARDHKERGRVLTFLRACADELRRVQWPDRKHVFQATVVVLVFCLIVGMYLGALDALVWQPLVEAIL